MTLTQLPISLVEKNHKIEDKTDRSKYIVSNLSVDSPRPELYSPMNLLVRYLTAMADLPTPRAPSTLMRMFIMALILFIDLVLINVETV